LHIINLGFHGVVIGRCLGFIKSMFWIQGTGKLESVAIDDWTPQTLPTWRHSNWVGVWDPWPVIFKLNPFVWYKVLLLELPERGTVGLANTLFQKHGI
jgi:hypothetical protein